MFTPDKIQIFAKSRMLKTFQHLEPALNPDRVRSEGQAICATLVTRMSGGAEGYGPKLSFSHCCHDILVLC